MVEKKALVHRLRLPGKVVADETRIYRINAAVDGWITKSMPVSAGSRVRKNETLGAFYRLEFLSAGQALLFALSSKDQFDTDLKPYADALKNLGMGDRQIQEMIKARKYTENVEITSPPTDSFWRAMSLMGSDSTKAPSCSASRT